MRFGVLGPLEVRSGGGPLTIKGVKERRLLGLLLSRTNSVVPVDDIIEALWGSEPPPSAAKSVQVYVVRVRKILEPGRRAGDGSVLSRRGRGYALCADGGQVDALRFADLVARAREAAAAGAYDVAAPVLREALSLWRGAAYADFQDTLFGATEAARLDEMRLGALEARIDADLALGRHAEVISELEALVHEYPLRERFWSQLMLALYRGGRQADALAAYRRVRALLAEELGLEPGEELRALEQAVLRQEVLTPPPAARGNLPVRLTSFVGREEELAAVGGLVGEARLVTLTGAGGAGKTRLAVEFAAAAGEFRDGVWLAELAGIAEAELVPSVVMAALGVRQSGEMAVMEALRYRLRSAELLLMLDNCEHLVDACAGLAVALLGSAPGLRVLATSREVLGVPGEAVYVVPPLPVPPQSSDVAALGRAAAVRLFEARARAAAGPGAAVPVQTVAGICRELDGLPLAIELAAARMSVLSAEEIAARLTDKFRLLARRRPVAGARHQTLKAAIGWSYDLLSEQERRVFAGLSVFADGFTLAAAAAVCCGGDQAAALDLVDQLVAKSLVVTQPAQGGTRYRLLETIRQYAAEALTAAGETEPARRRHAEVFLHLAETERDLGVLLPEQDNFRAALEHTLAGGSRAGPRLARALGGFWLARGLLQEARGWAERALAAGPAGPRLHADLLRLLGTVCLALGDLERAQAALAQGFAAAAAAGLPAAQARIAVLQADIEAEQSGHYRQALDTCAAAAPVLESADDLEGLAEAWLLVGKVHLWGVDVRAAEEALERAAAYARQSGNRHVAREARRWLAVDLLGLPIPADVAVGRVERLLDAAAGDPWDEAAILPELAWHYGHAGRFADARAACRRAQSILTASGAELDGAIAAMEAGRVELIAGDPAAAESALRPANEALRAMGEAGYRASVVGLLAEAAYAQGRFGQALRLTEEAEALAGADDFEAQGRWRATRAKLLARRGQFPAAARLADEAVTMAAAMHDSPEWAEFLVAQAEVHRLAGALDQAEASLRRALQFYEDRRIVPLAAQARILLASLATQRYARAQGQ
jgi:predicted ATPase/DNA-binding SARP family transcriptional activator